QIAARTSTNNEWVRLTGTVEVPECNLTELIAYVEGPSPGVTFYVDDVSLQVTELSSSGGAGGDLYGEYTVYTDWGTGYCLEMVIHNPTTQATTDWSAEVD